MTDAHIYAKPSRVSRAKVFPIRIVLPLTADMLSRLDAVRGDNEARLDVIREAVDKEVKRRERAKKS